MSFYDDIEAALNAGTEIMTRRAWFFDFLGYPFRIWEGNGKCFAAGQEWQGAIKGEQNYFQAPRLSDGRSGESPLYEFRLGYITKEGYDLLKNDDTVVKDRLIYWYRFYFKAGEYLRPLTAPLLVTTVMMKSRSFKETKVFDPASESIVSNYSVGVRARDGNEGQSEAPYAFVTDTDQNARSAALGVSPDRYARFVPLQINRTIAVN